jgi:hypothetical protein
MLPKMPIESWAATYDSYREHVLPGTGEWIFILPQFTAWQTASPDSHSILAIEGIEHSGKSYLASTRQAPQISATEIVFTA